MASTSGVIVASPMGQPEMPDAARTMGGCGGRGGIPMGDDSLPFEKVTVEDAKKSMDTTAQPPKSEEKDWRWARKWTPPEPMKAVTASWLLALPPELRPIDLPQAYPPIIN